MKKLIRQINIIIILCTGFTLDAYADGFPLTKPNDEGSNDSPGKGHRIPSTPIMCSIDWASGEITIQGYDVADIETFEILDETQTVCYCSTTDSADFLADLARTKGVVCIVFYFADFKLQGYYEY